MATKRRQDDSIEEQPPAKTIIDVDKLKMDIERYQRDNDIYKKENNRLQHDNKRLLSIIESKTAETEFYMALTRLKDIEIKMILLKIKNGIPPMP